MSAEFVAACELMGMSKLVVISKLVVGVDSMSAKLVGDCELMCLSLWRPANLCWCQISLSVKLGVDCELELDGISLLS